MLPEPDVADDFSLGSLDTTNIINNIFANYLSSSPAFLNFLSRIPFSLFGKSGSSTQFATKPLQTLQTANITELDNPGKFKTPQTVSFATTVTPASDDTNSHLPSMASNNPCFVLSHDNDPEDPLKPMVLSHHAPTTPTGTSTDKSILLSPFTNFDEHSTSDLLDNSTSSISTSYVKQINTKHHLKKKNKKTKTKNKNTKHTHASTDKIKNPPKKLKTILSSFLTATPSHPPLPTVHLIQIAPPTLTPLMSTCTRLHNN